MSATAPPSLVPGPGKLGLGRILRNAFAALGKAEVNLANQDEALDHFVQRYAIRKGFDDPQDFGLGMDCGHGPGVFCAYANAMRWFCRRGRRQARKGNRPLCQGAGRGLSPDACEPAKVTVVLPEEWAGREWENVLTGERTRTGTALPAGGAGLPWNVLRSGAET
jgi:hypothetical protein